MKYTSFLILFLIPAFVFGKLKPYQSVVNSETETTHGPFTVHLSNEGKLYFELSEDFMGTPFMLSTRILEVSDPKKAYAGEMRRDPIVLHFEKDNEKLLLQQPSWYGINESNDEGIQRAIEKNAIVPTLKVFPIITINPTNQNIVIDVTDFFSKEISKITPFASAGKPGTLMKEAGCFMKIQGDKSSIQIQSRVNYANKVMPFAAIINRSIVLLPEEPMRGRVFDRRMNYYKKSVNTYYADGRAQKGTNYITRFNIQPKVEDREAYFKGQLVEPQNPIVFYLDDAIPVQWRKYIKTGIEDWQEAFEEIGFKNAIVAKDIPNDPDFNLADQRINVFRYIIKDKANAMGLRRVDPRSGEIIQAEVAFYNNIIEILHDWYFIQCGATEADARKEIYDEALMGKLIRFAAAHEIGHCLGLEHNMRSSFAYDVEDLRNPTFTSENGLTPSIMDYARYNYVKQIGDDPSVKTTTEGVGAFDKFSIKWGYQLIPNTTEKTEYDILNQWITDHSGDPVYRFVTYTKGISEDPSAQSESLGNNPLKASQYGINNLKFIVNHLPEWTLKPNKGTDYMMRIYKEIQKQYLRYVKHVAANIGGHYVYFGVNAEAKPFEVTVNEKLQEESLLWYLESIINNSWLLNEEINQKVGNQEDIIIELNVTALDQIMQQKFLKRLEVNNQKFKSSDYLMLMYKTLFDKRIIASKNNLTLQNSFILNLLALSQGESDYAIGNDSFKAGSTAKINPNDFFIQSSAFEILQKVHEDLKNREKESIYFSLYLKRIAPMINN